jgi:hypothetical protein
MEEKEELEILYDSEIEGLLRWKVNVFRFDWRGRYYKERAYHNEKYNVDFYISGDCKYEKLMDNLI